MYPKRQNLEIKFLSGEALGKNLRKHLHQVLLLTIAPRRAIACLCVQDRTVPLREIT